MYEVNVEDIERFYAFLEEIGALEDAEEGISVGGERDGLWGEDLYTDPDYDYRPFPDPPEEEGPTP